MINYPNLIFDQKGLRKKIRFLSIFIVLLFASFFRVDSTSAQSKVNLKYDKIISGHHASMAISDNGTFLAWGQDIANDGAADNLTPVALNSTNYGALTGTVLFTTIGGTGGIDNRDQFVALTTDGLFAWGTIGSTSSSILSSLQKGTRPFGMISAPSGGDATTKLPTGVTPSDVTMMIGTYKALAIIANGNVWVLPNSGTVLEGDGTSAGAAWHKVKISAGVDLSNVIAIRGQNAGSASSAMMAITSDGLAYTWGRTTYLGDGSAVVGRNYATQMTLPAEFNATNVPKMIGVTGGTNNGVVANSYYVLSNSGNLYSLGDNHAKQLGDFTTNAESTSWVNVKSSAGTNFTNVNFISVQEHTGKFASAALITKTGVLYTWGDNDGNMIGRTSNGTTSGAVGTTYDPGIPVGFISGTDKAIYAEQGGHTLVYLKEGSATFCYVGHKIGGSMGDNTSSNGLLNSFDCNNTPRISILGAVPVPADPTQSVITASPTSIIANGTSTTTITVQLKDASGVNLTTTGGNVAVTTTNGSLGTVIDNNNGTYTVILTSANTITTTTLGFSVIGITATGVGSTATVNFIDPSSSPNMPIVAPSIPNMTITGTLNAFTTCSGIASTAQSFTISGASLTNNIDLSAPTGYEIATSAGGTFSNTIHLTPSSGTVTNTIIYVRLTANAFNGASGNVTAASVNATTFNIPTGIALVNPTVIASVSISSNATNNTICSSENIIFTATPSNGGNTPDYQWKLNGTNVGTNTSTYNSSSLSDNDVVSVVMTSSISSCVTATPASSNTITVKVNALPSSPVSISGLSSICLSSNQVYSIPNVIGATSYDWVVSGNLTTTSSTTNVINTTAGAMAGAGTIKVRSVNACGASAYTSDLNVTISNIPAPTPNFTLSANNICIGGPAINFTNTSTVNATTNSPIISYNWNFGDGSSAITTQNASNTYTSTGTFNVIMSITSQDNCNVSIAKSIIVDPLSVSGTVVAVNSTVCEGGSTTINLTGYTGAIQWMSSPAGANTWTNIIGATNAILNTGVLTSTTDFIAVVRSGLCAVATTSVVTVMVSPTPTITILNPSTVSTAATSFDLAYTINSGSPTAYTMNTVAPNTMPGFVSNTNYALSGSPLSILIPASASGIYNFNITVSNLALGCVSAANPFSLTVGNPTPAGLSYTTPNVYTVGSAISVLNPSSTGGIITAYSVSPSLPTGLILNTITGSITGTPITASAQTSYIVTGANVFGTITATVMITVNTNVQPPPTPTAKSIKYLYGNISTNAPYPFSNSVRNLPSGIIPVYRIVGASAFSTIPPAVPTAIGRYIFQISSYDTTAQLYSANFVNDTLIIAPPAPTVIDSVYILGVATNPSNIGVQVTGLAGATFNYVNAGIVQSSTPEIGTTIGTKRYTVSQIVNAIESDTVGFTVNMLDPNTMLHLQKIAEEPRLQSNATFNILYTFLVNNRTDKPMTNVLVVDSLQNTFPLLTAFTKLSLSSTGGLVTNSGFNGMSDINLLSGTSTLAANKVDTIRLTINLQPKGYTGTVNNVAVITATTPYGVIKMNSSSQSYANETSKTPTPSVIPNSIIEIPEIFTPNRDGVNDFFVIKKPYGVRIDLEVYNRWGTKVFTKNNYQNDWDGRGDNAFFGQDLVDGGYYYTIKALINNGSTQILKGFIIIQR